LLPASANQLRWERIVARFLIAVGVSAAADVLWWLHEPRQLTAPIDVVGYPAFANFDYIPSFLAYRLVIYAFPIGVLVVYSLLAWRGPLRRPPSARRRRPAAQMLDMPAAELDPQAVEPVTETGAGPVLAVVARLVLPALVVVVAASARSTSDHQGTSAVGLLCGLAYVLGVLILAAAISWVRTRPSRLRWAQVRSAIRAINGIGGAMAAVVGLWFVSLHSVVFVRSGHHAQYWPWLPAWLAAVGMLAIAAWGVLRLRGGRPPAAVEQRLLAVVVGAAAVFLITSQLPGQLGKFKGGFDEAQNLVGAHLLSKGYFPWRDFLFIHGLWLDGLQSTLGFSIFGSTRWGSAAGSAVLFAPLVWVILYLFAVWFSRSNRWFLAGVVVLLLSGLLNARDANFTSSDVRFIAAPVILVLLGEMLRRRSFSWCAALMFALVIQAILVPETLFLALPVLLVVVAADLTHREAGGRIWQAMRRSFWCAAVGVVLVGAWCTFLAINHSLSAWIQYFVVFVPGHNAEGAVPPSRILPRSWLEFAICVVLVLVTFWSVAARARGGRQWAPRDWVTVAAAGFIALYGEQALGRFDAQHVDVVFSAAMPLILLWSEQALTAADGLVRSSWSGTSLGRLVRSPATILAIGIVVVIAPATGMPTVVAAARFLPSHEHATADTQTAISGLGYTAPGAVSPVLLSDLAAALKTYAGHNGPVFDMTNSLGDIYYLLDRQPASRFVNVSLAITPYSQQLLIDSLRASHPPVVIFDSTTTGVPEWDGVRNNIRHYAVSQYLLDNYQPVLDTQGVLLLLRNDLMAGRPPVPRLTVRPASTNLYFSSPACDWGDIPNFLSSPVAGSSVELPVTSRERVPVTTVSGWAADPAAHAPVRELVVASGRKVLETLSPDVKRPHVAATIGQYALRSGFSATVTSQAGSTISVYGLAADGKLHPLAGQQRPLAGGMLALPDGRRVHIAAPTLGRVWAISSKDETLGVATIPAGLTIARFDMLTLHAAGSIGTAAITISDSAAASPSHDIMASVLPSSGRSVSVRVGSCLQWHGYQSRSLYVLQTGGAAIERLQLSGVTS
jgi:hypothetical protein